jgi:hypothetical protein
MKCSLCGFEFEQKEARTACAGCLLSKTCELARCPNCGFEMPLEPGWIKRLFKRKRKKDGAER